MRSTPSRKYSRPLALAAATAIALCLSAPALAHGNEANDPTQKTQAKTKADKDKMTAMQEDRRFLETAIASSHKELAALQVARQRASQDEVRDMANKLERDHSSLLDNLQETAVAIGVRPAQSLDTGIARTDSSMPASAGATGTSASSATATGSTGADRIDEKSSAAYGQTDKSVAAEQARAKAHKADKSGKLTGEARAASNDPEIKALAAKSGMEFDRAFLDKMITDHRASIDKFNKAAADTSLNSRVRTLASQSLPTLRSHLEMAQMLRSNLDAPRAQ